MGTRWVCLDVGETLIDETRVFATWADVLGVPRCTLAAVLGGMIAQGRDHLAMFELLHEVLGAPPHADRHAEVEARYGGFRAEDLYADALPALTALTGAGYRVAIVANQPVRRHEQLVALGVDPEVMAMSEALGVAKPDPAFYAAALRLMGDPDPARVAYVGDRVDNDVLPAAAAGLRPVWLRRGPWGLLGEDTTGAAALEVRSLAELVERVGAAFGP